MIRDRFKLNRQWQQHGMSKRLDQRLQESKALADQRRENAPAVRYPEILPVSDRVDDIKQAICDHQVIILAGETGSGKTTQIPKICLDLGRGIYGTIGHTQPRRVAVRTVSARLAEEMDVTLGEQVGYQIRFSDRSKAISQVKVMTDGVLLAETQHDRFLENYDTLIIDEAHERSLNIDFLIGYIKRILPKRPDLKIIITSATIDLDRFSDHFKQAPVIEVSGRTYPVEVCYRPLVDQEKREDSDERMYKGVLNALDEIRVLERAQGSPGGVLIFLSGEREIRELALLIKRSSQFKGELLPLYGRLSNSEQNRVFAPVRQSRIVLATNVAETSLTVPGIRYVIDTGLARISRYSVNSKVQRLPIEPISRASAEQRKGRCGRVSAGVCFRLYSEEDFLARPEFTTPEILRTNLAAVLLQMLKLRLGDAARFPFIERPEQRQVNDGFMLLHELAAVDDQRSLSKTGRQIAEFPIDLRLARIILEARRFGCLTEILVIVSALSIQDPRERPQDAQQKADLRHRAWRHEQSDFMDYWNLWVEYEALRQESTQGQLRRYCRANFLSFLRMREWRDIHTQLLLVCRAQDYKFNHEAADYTSIHRAILAGFLGQIAQKSVSTDYTGARNRHYHVFPASSQFKRKPKWIVAASLVETSRLFARTVAEIDVRWIEPIAEHLVKRRYFEPYFAESQGQVLCHEELTLYGLVIQKRRVTDYALIDPIEAREIFITEALVSQKLEGDFPFLKANQALIEEIEVLESKSRKRDLLVDHKVLFEFYDEALPETLCTAMDLGRLLGNQQQFQKRLLLTQSNLLQRQIEVSDELYPDSLKVGGNELKLAYQFKPSEPTDGVSVDVPVSLLRQVPREKLDWLIPGLLREKCLALIRSLPKSLRKNFVPAPQYADLVLEKLQADQGRSLQEALADSLFRLSGVRIAVTDFNEQRLDQHLAMLIRILGEDGEILGMGRDLDALINDHAPMQTAGLLRASQHDLEQSGLVDWSFDDLPDDIMLEQGGVNIQGFPALVDQQDAVAIQIFDQKRDAEFAHEQGSLRLIMLQLQDQQKYLNRNIVDFDSLALFYATRGSKPALLEDMVEAVFRITLLEGRSPIRSRQVFQDRLALRQNLFDTANRISGLLLDVLQRANAIESRLGQFTDKQWLKVAEDLRRQMNFLFRAGFLRRISFHWLSQYTRYLKAIEYRLEKLGGGFSRDEQRMQHLKVFEDRLATLGSADLQQKMQFSWLLQEYRVSVFAQSLGTVVPVSEKRLEKAWQALVSSGQ